MRKRIRRGRRLPSSHRLRRDVGFTVTEILITVVLLGIVAAGILNAVMTSITASAVSRSAARVETALVNAADRVNRAGNDVCDYTIYAQASVMTEWGQSAAGLASVSHYRLDPGADGHADDAEADKQWVAWNPVTQCPSGSEPPPGIVRKVVVTITSPDGAVTRSIEVVKSDD